MAKTEAVADKDATDTSAADKAATDKAAADKATSDKATADKAASDKAAADAATAAASKKPEGGEAAKDGDGTGQAGAPEKYALKAPEGGMVDASELTAFEKIVRQHNLTNEAAQTLLEQENEHRVARSTELAVALTADPDYGGDKLAETQRLAKTVIDRVRPEGHPRRAAFQRLLDQSGYGNHIEVASFFADLGKMTAEDTPVSGGKGGGDRAATPLANRMYPGMK